MKLWILKPRAECLKSAFLGRRAESSPWYDIVDMAYGFVVRAQSESEAREIASTQAGDEARNRRKPWLDPQYTTCERLTGDGAQEIILKDFHAG